MVIFNIYDLCLHQNLTIPIKHTFACLLIHLPSIKMENKIFPFFEPLSSRSWWEILQKNDHENYRHLTTWYREVKVSQRFIMLLVFAKQWSIGIVYNMSNVSTCGDLLWELMFHRFKGHRSERKKTKNHCEEVKSKNGLASHQLHF